MQKWFIPSQCLLHLRHRLAVVSYAWHLNAKHYRLVAHWETFLLVYLHSRIFTSIFMKNIHCNAKVTSDRLNEPWLNFFSLAIVKRFCWMSDGLSSYNAKPTDADQTCQCEGRRLAVGIEPGHIYIPYPLLHLSLRVKIWTITGFNAVVLLLTTKKTLGEWYLIKIQCTSQFFCEISIRKTCSEFSSGAHTFRYEMVLRWKENILYSLWIFSNY